MELVLHVKGMIIYISIFTNDCTAIQKIHLFGFVIYRKIESLLACYSNITISFYKLLQSLVTNISQRFLALPKIKKRNGYFYKGG
jgi:hypothetical protein